VGGFEAAQRVLTDICGARSAGAADAGAAAKRGEIKEATSDNITLHGRTQGRPAAPALLPRHDGSYVESAPVEAGEIEDHTSDNTIFFDHSESASAEAARSPRLRKDGERSLARRSTWHDRSHPERAVRKAARPGSILEQYRKDSENWRENTGLANTGLGPGAELTLREEQEVGVGRIVALYHRSALIQFIPYTSTYFTQDKYIWCLYF
jgi:hypothetical protein